MDEQPEYDVPAGVGSDLSPGDQTDQTQESDPEFPPQHEEEGRIPYSRFQEVNVRGQQSEQRALLAEQRTEELQRKVEALMGIAPKEAPPDPKESAIRESLERMYPGLRHLQDLPFDKLREVLETVPRLRESAETAQKAQHRGLADDALKTLWDSAAKDVFSGQALTPKQKTFFQRDFSNWVGNDPANLDRYTAGNSSVLVKEYLTEMSTEVLSAIRRSAAVTTGARVARSARVPTGGAVNGPVGTPQKAMDLGDEDAVHDAAAASFFKRRQ